MARGTLCHIDSKLILIKLHYFFLFGGLGGSLPFVALLGKSLNLSATSIGLCYTTINCLVLLTTPLLGSLVDYFQSIKLFLMGLLVSTAVTGVSLLFIPPINRGGLHEPKNRGLDVSHLVENLMPLHLHNNTGCPESPEINCTLIAKARNISELFPVGGFKRESFDSKRITESTIPHSSNSSNETLTFEKKLSVDKKSNLTQAISIESGNFTSKSQTNKSYYPSHYTEPLASVYSFYEFWIFALLVVLGGLSHSNANSLSDVACYEILDDQRQLYGSQRLFGTIGWAIVCSLSGVLNDISSENKAKKDYSPGIYLMGTLLAVDLIFIVSRMPLVKAKFSTDMSGDLKKVIRSSNVMLFAVGATAVGALSTVVSNYEFWLLQDMGASQTLLGATVVIQCSIEVPSFMISAWIVKKFGSFNCLVLTFVAFAFRCGLYYTLYNPWWALAIDTTHGMTFALFHFSLTNFASVSAPAGMEATVLGMLHGMTSGLGHALGNVLAGATLDTFGSRMMFCFASIFSGICGVCFIILPRFIDKIQRTSKISPPRKTDDVMEHCL